jgi:predicted nucleic-acid-binding protein
MSDRRIIDTNLIVRHLVRDDVEHAEIARKLFKASDRGEIILIILPAVLAECVFVLDSFYKQARSLVARALIDLITSAGVEIADPGIHRDALERYSATKLHYVDCVITAYAAAEKMPVATMDKAFRKIADVRVSNQA